MPAQEPILAALCALLGAHAPPGVTVDEGTGLVEDLGLDSPKVLERILEIEDRFDISVPMNVLADVHTVGDLAQAIGPLVEAHG